MRVVLDTNILISLFRFKTASRLLDMAAERKFLMVTSPYIMGEMVRNLLKLEMPVEKVAESLVLAWNAAAVIAHPEDSLVKRIAEETGNPKDAPILAACVVTAADYLVTGEKRLLELGRYGVTRIIFLREFLSLLGEE